MNTMDSLTAYATRWQRDADNNFAVACYDQNSLDELYEASSTEPDQTDCENWGITPEEWHDAIRAALIARTALPCPGCGRWLSPERDDPAPCEMCDRCIDCCACSVEERA